MATFRSSFEKKLDKSLQSWYNTRNKEREMIFTIDNLIERRSSNKDRSVINLTLLGLIGTAIKKVNEQERYSSLRTPVIAGGAVRDTIFGLVPNDWDIFFDVSSVEGDEDERDDFVMLYLSDLLDEMSKSPVLEPHLARSVIEPLDNPYADPKQRDHWNNKQFIVYQNGWNYANAEYPGLPMHIQAIGREDKRLTDDPVSFLDEFDYSAVKALYDPSTDEFMFHDDFKKFINTKEIECDNDKTYHRIRSFLDRFWPSKPNIKVIDNRPKVDPNQSGLDAIFRQIANIQEPRWNFQEPAWPPAVVAQDRVDRVIGN